MRREGEREALSARACMHACCRAGHQQATGSSILHFASRLASSTIVSYRGPVAVAAERLCKPSWRTYLVGTAPCYVCCSSASLVPQCSSGEHCRRWECTRRRGGRGRFWLLRFLCSRAGRRRRWDDGKTRLRRQRDSVPYTMLARWTLCSSMILADISIASKYLLLRTPSGFAAHENICQRLGFTCAARSRRGWRTRVAHRRLRLCIMALRRPTAQSTRNRLRGCLC